MKQPEQSIYCNNSDQKKKRSKDVNFEGNNSILIELLASVTFCDSDGPPTFNQFFFKSDFVPLEINYFEGANTVLTGFSHATLVNTPVMDAPPSGSLTGSVTHCKPPMWSDLKAEHAYG